MVVHKHKLNSRDDQREVNNLPKLHEEQGQGTAMRLQEAKAARFVSRNPTMTMNQKIASELVAVAKLLLGRSLQEVVPLLKPTTQKVMQGLSNRFHKDGIRLEIIRELPAQKASENGNNPNSYYSIVWYGLMTQANKYGRCGVIQVTTTYDNEEDVITISMRANFGNNKAVVFPSASPVGIVTKVLNHIRNLDASGNGVESWIQTYVPSSAK